MGKMEAHLSVYADQLVFVAVLLLSAKSCSEGSERCSQINSCFQAQSASKASSCGDGVALHTPQDVQRVLPKSIAVSSDTHEVLLLPAPFVVTGDLPWIEVEVMNPSAPPSPTTIGENLHVFLPFSASVLHVPAFMNWISTSYG